MATNDRFEAKILVLDDERLIRLTVCARLKRAGYEAVPVATVDEAVAALKLHIRSFCAVISDIMMGDMDGFVFRDIVRGMDPLMPFFFMTALDPEEGSGFLKRIIGDPLSYYLPKSAGTEVLVKRLQRVVGARHIQQFVENQVEEQRKSLALAAHVQSSMLPVRAMMDDKKFYTTWWQPHESVSGDLYDAMPIDGGRMLFALGDIQGHGTNAALVMMAVQAFLRQTVHSYVRDGRRIAPELLANQMHGFFRANFAEMSYMTAVICIFAPPAEKSAERTSGGTVEYITCGAPDLRVFDAKNSSVVDVNPQNRGGLPIGLMPDTVYTKDDIVRVVLPSGAICTTFTDGLYELSKDGAEGQGSVPSEFLRTTAAELAGDALKSCSLMVLPDKFMCACSELGYPVSGDDVSIIVFGAVQTERGTYEATTQLSPALVDAAARHVAAWCAAENWPDDLAGRIQLVLEEHLMNIYDHGYDEQHRRRGVVSLRLRRMRDFAQLSVWDHGRPTPGMQVAAGDAATAFDLINREFGNHGRGRLMMRQLCESIQRQRFGKLNETTFHIPWTEEQEEHQ
ncbi:MAG: SpoIIE family protein phosphatase [Kiritimatiellae bacterium]|nr:SpoIIE family protein phosphatase [Kiritimatiellia bacterium]